MLKKVFSAIIIFAAIFMKLIQLSLNRQKSAHNLQTLIIQMTLG